jgi:predicted nucleotidyltransferase
MTVIPPVEGYFLVTDEGLIFEVKGVVHPEGRIVAYLRYVPDTQGERNSSDGYRYKKIYSLKERELYLQENHPKYLWNSDVHGRTVQSVPTDDVAFTLSPVDALRQLRDMGSHVSPLQEAARELAELLVKESGISWSDIGITGSLLVGLETTRSDLDMIVFGEAACRTLHTHLVGEESVPRIKRYQGEFLEKHLRFRWPEHDMMLDKLRVIEAKKAFQGVYQTWEFFVRAVKLPAEVNWKYNDFLFERETDLAVRAQVLDDSDSIFTPCYYTIECDELPALRYLTSYRGRFCEHVEKGMEIEAEGRLETVRNVITQDEYQQVVLGERRSDYLIPI